MHPTAGNGRAIAPAGETVHNVSHMSWLSEVVGNLIGAAQSAGLFGKSLHRHNLSSSDEVCSDCEQREQETYDGELGFVDGGSVRWAIVMDNLIAECQRSHSHESEDELLACLLSARAAITESEQLE